ncbi:MAG TPA: EAL domain-containing protein, partial [Solirubrobacteraceae bacterium]
ARGFKLQTVAEGVEDADTFEMLRALGVDFAQGYHIARPQPMLAASAQAVLSANGRAGAPPSALRSTNESTQ